MFSEITENIQWGSGNYFNESENDSYQISHFRGQHLNRLEMQVIENRGIKKQKQLAIIM